MTVPFSDPNSRIFYACQGVFVEERNAEEGNSGNPTTATFLHGVQSVGISSDNPERSLADIGRHQRKYTLYQQQTIEITIDRVLARNEDTFYKVTDAQYTDYKNSHILHANNFGSKGAKDANNKVLRNYDITILYGSDKFSRFSAGIGGTEDDADNVISVSYLNCLITNINYSIGIDGVRESITLTTKNLKYNNDYSTLSDYTWPDEFTEQVPDTSPPQYLPEDGNILKRQHFDLTETNYGDSRIPTEIKELFNFDTPVEQDGKQVLGIQSINISASFDYRTLSDVGVWRGSISGKEHEQNRWAILNLPISVTCSFTGIIRQAMPYNNFLSSGLNRVRNVDNIYTKSLGEGSSTEWQEADKEIKIVALGLSNKKFVWDLGKKNYLTSIEYSGGDAGGGNVEATINYTNQYSDFVITKTESVLDLTNTGTY